MKALIMRLQADLQAAGLYAGEIDGDWGPLSQAAWDAALASAQLRCDAKVPSKPAHVNIALPWSAGVSAAFCDRIIWIAAQLRMPAQGADWLMACIAWETGRTFSPSVRNGAGSGATGLIQFMPSTSLAFFFTPKQIEAMTLDERRAKGIESTDRLAAMTAEQQLDYVYQYFLPYRGRLQSLADCYMAILWPAGIGKAPAWVLWDAQSRPITYRQNAGLDINKDGAITKAEATAKVQGLLDEGRREANRRAA